MKKASPPGWRTGLRWEVAADSAAAAEQCEEAKTSEQDR